ncbi:MAG: ABC transporter permease [Gallionella sp.]|nr:ABC transporter permease [Gallionella sp.]
MFTPPLAGIFNLLVIGITLSLPTGLYVLLTNAQTLTTQLSSTPQVSLYLQMNTQEDDVAKLRKQLDQHPDIARSEFVPRLKALEQLKQTSGLSDVIDSLEKNPLPDAFIVHPKQSDAPTLEKLRNELAKLPKVEIAQLDSAWAYKLEALLKFAWMVVIILTCLLSLALIAITFNTIRLQILTRHEEIEVAKLIGATNSFIRRPYLYFGALQGLLGGIAAWLIITISVMLLNYNLVALSQLYASQFVLHSLSLGDSLTLLMFSMYLGWLGAWLSVARLLSRIETR